MSVEAARQGRPEKLRAGKNLVNTLRPWLTSASTQPLLECTGSTCMGNSRSSLSAGTQYIMCILPAGTQYIMCILPAGTQYIMYTLLAGAQDIVHILPAGAYTYVRTTSRNSVYYVHTTSRSLV